MSPNRPKPLPPDYTIAEWQAKVIEQLTTLHAQVESLDEKIDRMQENIQITNMLLQGDDGLIIKVDRLQNNSVEDFKIRLDRIEVKESRRDWLSKATIAACIAAIFAVVRGLFTGTGK